MRGVLDRLPRGVPTIVFTRNAGHALPALVETGASCVGLDWTVDLAAARAAHGARVALQGNLDPVALLTDPVTVARAATDVVRAAGRRPGTSSTSGTASCRRPRRRMSRRWWKPFTRLHEVTVIDESAIEGLDKGRKAGFARQLCTRIGHLSYVRRCDENCANRRS
jgi:hypothetical protein